MPEGPGNYYPPTVLDCTDVPDAPCVKEEMFGPVLAVTAFRDEADAIRRLMELRRYADEDLKRKLEPVTGVAAVKVGGGLEDEVQVDIDQR